VRRYLAARLLQSLGVVVFVTTFAFVMVHLAPGDPIGVALSRSNIPDSVREQWRVAYGLDRPVSEQYVRWVGNTFRGDLGYSFSFHRPVREVLLTAIPNTLLLSGLGLLLSFAIGISLGLVQAERPRSSLDKWFGRVLLALYSVPDFWLALVILMVFAYKLPLFPAGGMTDPVMYDYMSLGDKLADRLHHLVLPVVTLALLTAAGVARYQRGALVAVLHSDWMRTALAKGLSWKTAVRRHAFRNALLPTLTLFGLSVPAYATGAIFVEKVFSWPGMGLVVVNAIAARDYPLVTSGVMMMSVLVAACALLTDLAVAAADPRVRLG
jgi:ABC-type dipeptide/oligopeptide/nickel transport systems, permease components